MNNKYHDCTKHQAGQTLIEVLVGLATLVVVIAAITSSVLSSLYDAEFSKSQSLATSYAEQGVEILRNMRNNDIASLSASYLTNPSYCLGSECTGLVPGTLNQTGPSNYCWTKLSVNCPQNIETFVREVDVNQNSTKCQSSTTDDVEANVSVSWSDSKCTDALSPFCHSISVSTCFSNFTIAPTP